MYPSRIITRADTLAHQRVVTSAYSLSERMDLLSDAIELLISETRNRFPMFGATTVSVNQVKGVLSQSLPNDFERFLKLYDPNARTLEQFPVDGLSNFLSGVGFSWMDGMKLHWVNCDDTKTWTLLYTRSPVRLHKGIATAVTATSITFPAETAAEPNLIGSIRRVNDYYNGCRIIDTGSATAARKYQIGTITDFVAETLIASVAWPVAIPDGALTYELLPMIDPVRWEALLAWELAIQMLAIDRADDKVFASHHPHRRLRSEFDSAWRSIQQRLPGNPRNYVSLELSE